MLLIIMATLALPIPVGNGTALSNYNVPALRAHVTSLDAQLSSNVSLVSSLRGQVSSLQSQIASDQSQIASDQSQLASDQSKIASDQSQINTLQSQVSSDASQISTMKSEVQSLQNEVANYNNQISTLQSEINTLDTKLSLGSYTSWLSSDTISQPASYYTYWTETTQYAGYITVTVQSSTTSNTYAIVQWSADGVTYDQSITIGMSGSATFPVLPASSVEVGVGNTNFVNGATETISITYVY